MKSRKALSHTLLINELYEQLKFPLKVGAEARRRAPRRAWRKRRGACQALPRRGRAR